MDILTLAETKEFLRLDYDDEDNFLQLCIQNAEEYIRDAIDDFDNKIQIERFQRKAKLLAMMLIQDMFDNRELMTKDSEKYKYIAKSLIMQMNLNSYENV
ncbi:phage gp6-like head-tail connector protein [Clostridium sporogenes]|uniref:head-tail connector protein n=1 Tax=Clostridium sporogenes TaxID=1509 RepID=UPI0013D14F1A|nr:head-tail connector protein [Clostridium sporogenes]NFF69377.1 phage gp6-like head-tail connector protein [Clostridium sporogenes]NFG00683.1 phage gp6-like head-tail connector protein [Clostridium sporogenes]NFG08253.1 phage gp6-like head-tail connector protein [Clostridium sporogenes]NFG53383.1 phage gp6-like head-tail connector protein [Clostridium sporogenes]NFP86210.1 phage gp6-like head-tail connector protein [Clostridium sporogenes]